MFNIIFFFHYWLLFILISFILNVLTLIDWKFNKNTLHGNKSKLFECGFETTSLTNTTITVGSLLLLLFVILYEIEFFFIIIIFVEFNNLNFFFKLLSSFLLITIVLTVYLDFKNKQIQWLY